MSKRINTDTMKVAKSCNILTMVALAAIPAISAFTSPSTHTHTHTHTPAFYKSSKLHMSSTVELPSGLIKKVTKPGMGPPIRVGDVATVKFTCDVVDENGESSMPFAKSSGQKFVVGDGLMIDGWEFALQSMRGGERSIVRITDPRLGYGAAGVPPIVPENAIVEMDLEVLEVEAGVDLGTIASADPLKPRTPASIAAAYNTRRENAAMEQAEELEGIEGMIAKFKTFYFFGFFEGETGQQAPWYLRPSITFPIAFAVVGVTFWVAYAGGGISERGAQVTDELDELILSMSNPEGGSGGGLMSQAVVMAFLANMGISI